MRKVSFLLICALIGTIAQASSIHGKVIDRKGTGKSGIKVIIQGDLGYKFEDTSLVDGSFRVNNVPEGWYLIRLENLENYNVVDPACGWYYDYIGEDGGGGGYDFTIESSGVSVDFGRPGGGSGGGSVPFIGKTSGFDASSTFSLSVYADGLMGFGFEYATRLEIEGWWYSQGQGPLDVDVVAGYQAGSYVGSGLEVSYDVGLGNKIYLTMEMNEFPYLTIDGEMATFIYQPSPGSRAILAQNGDNACFCITSVRIWSESTLLYDSADQWCDQLEIN